MPSVSRAQHKLMEIAAHKRGGFGGVPQTVGRDFVAADKAANRFQRKEIGMNKDMVSPRKAMAMGDGGDFGTKGYPMGVPHPDVAAATGTKNLADHERGAPPGVMHAKGQHAAQAAPNHGPTNPGGYGSHFRREGKA